MPCSSTSSRINSATAMDGCVSFNCAAQYEWSSPNDLPRIRSNLIMSWSEQDTKKYCCSSRSSFPASGSSLG